MVTSKSYKYEEQQSLQKNTETFTENFTEKFKIDDLSNNQRSQVWNDFDNSEAARKKLLKICKTESTRWKSSVRQWTRAFKNSRNLSRKLKQI